MAGVKDCHEVLYTQLYPAQLHTDYVHRYQHKHLIKGLELSETAEAAAATTARPTDDKRFRCPHCDKRFKRNDHLKRHTLTQHTDSLAARVGADEPHKCAHCGKSFKRGDILKRHALTHCDAALRCQLCDRSFSRADHLRRHLQRAHAAPGGEAWRARRTQSEERAFKCCQCDSWYKRNDHLKRHVLSAHTDSPQLHYCPTCDKTFKRRDHLMRHMETKHTPETRRFRCGDCRQDFVGLENLVAHEQIVHGITPAPRLPCPHCEVTFKRRDHMIRHINSKHLNQVVSCPLCPSLYKRRDHLIRHLREKHKAAAPPPSPHQHLALLEHDVQPEVHISC